MLTALLPIAAIDAANKAFEKLICLIFNVIIVNKFGLNISKSLIMNFEFKNKRQPNRQDMSFIIINL